MLGVNSKNSLESTTVTFLRSETNNPCGGGATCGAPLPGSDASSGQRRRGPSGHPQRLQHASELAEANASEVLDGVERSEFLKRTHMKYGRTLFCVWRPRPRWYQRPREVVHAFIAHSPYSYTSVSLLYHTLVLLMLHAASCCMFKLDFLLGLVQTLSHKALHAHADRSRQATLDLSFMAARQVYAS